MWKNLLDLFIPNHCAGCNETLLQGEHILCMQCYHSLDFIPAGKNGKHEILIQQLFGKVVIKEARGLLYYDKDNGITQNMIKKLKYKGREDVGDFLAEISWQRFEKTNLFHQIDYLCCVPLHPRKFKQRGYNQLHRFGKKISQLSGIPFRADLLVRNFYEQSQTRKNIFNRSIVTKDKFSFRPNLINPNANLLLIDDVITTGSTMEQVVKAIQQHQTGDVSVLCMASTYSD